MSRFKVELVDKQKLKTKSLDKLQILMKNERKMVLHSVQAKWPSLRKKRLFKEQETRKAELRHEEEHCNLIKIAGAVEN